MPVTFSFAGFEIMLSQVIPIEGKYAQVVYHKITISRFWAKSMFWMPTLYSEGMKFR